MSYGGLHNGVGKLFENFLSATVKTDKPSDLLLLTLQFYTYLVEYEALAEHYHLSQTACHNIKSDVRQLLFRLGRHDKVEEYKKILSKYQIISI